MWVCQISGKTKNFDFFSPNLAKNGFRFCNSENYVRIRISIVKMPCMLIFRENEQPWLFRPKFAQKWVLGSKFQNSKSGFGIYILKIPCAPIFEIKQTILNFRAQICSKMDFGVGISKIEAWIWLEWTPPIYHVYQFSVKMDKF